MNYKLSLIAGSMMVAFAISLRPYDWETVFVSIVGLSFIAEGWVKAGRR